MLSKPLMEGMQARSTSNGRRYAQARLRMTSVCGIDHPRRPSAPRDSQGAVISACIRFRQFPGVQELRLTQARY